MSTLKTALLKVTGAYKKAVQNVPQESKNMEAVIEAAKAVSKEVKAEKGESYPPG